MKEKNENKVDRLFKDGLSGSGDHIAFREEDWTAMERLLDKKTGKKIVPIRGIYYAAGIAALLLLAIGLFFFNKNDKAEPARNNLHTKNKTNTKGNNDQTRQPFKDAVPDLPAGNERLGNNKVNSGKKKPGLPLTVDRNGRYFQNNSDQAKATPEPFKIPGDSSANNISGIKTVDKDNKMALVTTVDTLNNMAATAQRDTTANVNELIPQVKTKAGKLAVKPLSGNGPRFTLSILAAPDVNAVNSFSRNQVGTNIGLQLSVRLSKKFSITSGAAYAIKPYQTSGSQYNSVLWQYKPSADRPNYVAANCKVLDIPVNINYQFYSKGKNALALGTGLSSYIMLRENYRFDYNDGSGRPSYDIQIDNRNKHWFGVLNVNATYEHRINSKFSTIIQPYVKLPLTGIGNGRVDLKSTGVALGVSWNINSVLKSK